MQFGPLTPRVKTILFAIWVIVATGTLLWISNGNDYYGHCADDQVITEECFPDR